MKDLSVVIPVYGCEGCLRALCARLRAAILSTRSGAAGPACRQQDGQRQEREHAKWCGAGVTAGDVGPSHESGLVMFG